LHASDGVQVILPDLALLHFNVYDNSDNKKDLAYACIALNSIRPGFRHIPLKVSLRAQQHPSLLVSLLPVTQDHIH
jgi:hypothetical protein